MKLITDKKLIEKIAASIYEDVNLNDFWEDADSDDKENLLEIALNVVGIVDDHLTSVKGTDHA